MTKLPNQFLTKWINFWVFVFCITVLAIDGHGGEAVIILLLTMVYIFITSLNGVFFINDDKSKYKLNRFLTAGRYMYVCIYIYIYICTISY